MYSSEMKQRARELRKNMTREESRLWYDFLRGYPVRFLRQHPVDCYILDFYCSAARLAIELDGSQHFEDDALAYDEKRDAALAKHGIVTLRFPNNAVREQFRGVCEMIDLEVKKRLPSAKDCP